jgi:hypothetical protein
MPRFGKLETMLLTRVAPVFDIRTLLIVRILSVVSRPIVFLPTW